MTATLALLALDRPAHAAPPTLHERKSIEIGAPAEKVWAITGSFPDLTWVPAVKSSTATDGNNPGSRRTLDFGGAQMTETLVSHDEVSHSYTYRIDDTEANHKIAPVSDVTATVSVARKGTNESVLTWDATFRRLDQSAHPKAGADDAAAKKQIATVFQVGLAGAKAKATGH